MVGVRPDERHLVRAARPVQRGRHGHRAHVVAGDGRGVQPGVGERRGVRLLGREGGRRGRRGVAGQRRADREDLAPGDGEGDEAVVPGREVTEALPQGDHASAADRADQHPLQAGDRLGVEAEEIAVVGEVGAGGGLGVGGQSGGERGVAGPEGVRGAQLVPPHVRVGLAGEPALAGVRRGAAGAVVDVGVLVTLGERSGAALRGRADRRRGGAGTGGQQRGDHRGRRQDGDEPAASPAHPG